jgi:LysR family glycine cleavage system transcriptional activator
MGRFLAAHPDIDLDVRATMSLVDFRRDDVEAALRYGGGNYPGVVSEHLLDDVYYPVCSPNLGGGRLPTRPAEISRYLLLRSENEFWQPWFRAGSWAGPRAGRLQRRIAPDAGGGGRTGHRAGASAVSSDTPTACWCASSICRPSPFHYYQVARRGSPSAKLIQFRAWLARRSRDEAAPVASAGRADATRARAPSAQAGRARGSG